MMLEPWAWLSQEHSTRRARRPPDGRRPPRGEAAGRAAGDGLHPDIDVAISRINARETHKPAASRYRDFLVDALRTRDPVGLPSG